MKIYLVATNGSFTMIAKGETKKQAISKVKKYVKKYLGYTLEGYEAYELAEVMEDDDLYEVPLIV